MHILIVEDESVSARRLARMTQEILGKEVSLLEIRSSLEESEDFLANQELDLLLLDLNLNGEDGFDLLQSTTTANFATIVVSANTDQAIRAFEFGVVDFVPKPFDLDRLKVALERYRNRAVKKPSLRYLSVRSHGKLKLLPVNDIKYLKGAGDLVEAHLADGQMALYSKTLEHLEGILPSQFQRIHKSYIVDMKRMRQIHLQGGGRYHMELVSGEKIPISRRKYRELKDNV